MQFSVFFNQINNSKRTWEPTHITYVIHKVLEWLFIMKEIVFWF